MQITLLSTQFLALAAVSVLLVAGVRGQPRQYVFLALNSAFLWWIFLGPIGTLSTVVFSLTGFVGARMAARFGRRGLTAGIVLYTALFVYQRQYDFVTWVLPDILLTDILRTVGLSFLFFKAVHVMIDAAGGTLGRIDLITYLNYSLNFTTFAMGPIQRFQDYRDQWEGVKTALEPRLEAHLDAGLRALAGLAKAYVLAPFVADYGLQPDTDLLSLGLTGLFVQSWAFWIYLYLNFSGYCDIVIGIGSLLGVRPPENFNRPFLARNISDFWQRQHRSLTLWLTDYVFNPLYRFFLTRPATTRHRLLAANLSLVVTMLVSGLWHGTTVSFLIFGLVHGLWFVVYRTWDHLLTTRLGRQRVKQFRQHPLVHAGGIVLTFNATALAFVFFQLRPERVVEAIVQVAGR